MTVIEIILSIFGLWVAAVLVFFLLGALLVKPVEPCFTGFAICMPGWLWLRLSEEEIEAVYQHELGHQHHWHVWKNLLSLCCFVLPSKETRYQQELEADDYAVAAGYGLLLASALAKLGRQGVAGRVQRLRGNQVA